MSKFQKWVLVVLVLATITIAGLLIGFNIWSNEILYVAIYDAGLCVGTFIYLKYALDKEKEKAITEELKRKWDYSMNKCSEMTKRALGGVSLQWRQGRGRSSSEKYFKVGMKQLKYYVFDAVLSETQEPVMVFWDCDNENVACYYSNPPQEMYDQPFKFWKPSDESNAQFVTNRFGKPVRSGYPSGIRIGFDNGDSVFNEQPEQQQLDENYMDDVANRIQR